MKDLLYGAISGFIFFFAGVGMLTTATILVAAHKGNLTLTAPWPWAVDDAPEPKKTSHHLKQKEFNV